MVYIWSGQQYFTLYFMHIFPQFRIFFSLLFVCLAVTLNAQLSPQEINIPMRDGKTLSAHLYLPNATGNFPTILIQTPYNKDTYKSRGLPLGVRYDLANSNYAFVIVDWRCFYGSTAACTGGQPDRGNDGYDAVEWIAAQSWSDGKIGTWGPSALGNVQYNTAFKRPPHLVCAVPEVSSPQFRYDDYYPGGVLTTGRIQSLNVLYGGVFNTVIDNPYYNNIWEYVEANNFHLDSVNIPMLLVAGWYDHNTNPDLELIEQLRAISDPSVRNKHKILIGPWVHGGTGQAFVGSEIQGELTYPLAANKNHAYENAFFDFYLRGISNKWESDTAVYTFYQMGDEKWVKSSTWPAQATSTKTLYFSSDNTLTDTIPTDGDLSYSYDPTDPSPTVGGKTLDPADVQGPLDQRDSVESRSDALVFTSATLTEDVKVQGTISVKLHVGSDKKDTDFMARLTEVYPDGRSMLLGETAIRMHYRNGFTTADTAYMTPGEVYEVNLNFDELANTFNAGHKIRVIITSSNYSQFNRNMNTGDEMYPNTNADTLVNPEVATNQLFMGTGNPSSLTLEIVSCDPYYKQVGVNICNGSSYQLPNGTFVSDEGLYESTFTSSLGCDSTIATFVILFDSIVSYDSLAFCAGDAYVLPDGQLATKSGNYRVRLATLQGCDSIVYFNLVFNPSPRITKTVEFCEGTYYLLPNGDSTDVPVTIIDSALTAFGCDSVHILRVVYAPPYEESVTHEFCQGDYAYLPNGDSSLVSLTYIDSLKASDGCDSIVTHDYTRIDTLSPVVTVDTVNAGLYRVFLGVDENEVSISWWELDGTPITTGNLEQMGNPGDTITVFYEVQSECDTAFGKVVLVYFEPQGIQQFVKSDLSVYPNPTTGVVTVRSTEKFEEILVLDLSGRELMRSDRNWVDLRDLPKGVYLLEVYQKNEKLVTKILKY